MTTPGQIVALHDQIEAEDRESLGDQWQLMFRPYRPGEVWPEPDTDYTVTAVWIEDGRWRRKFARADLGQIREDLVANGCPCCRSHEP